MKNSIFTLVLASTVVSSAASANELDVGLRVGSQIATDTSFDALQDSNYLTYSTLQIGYGLSGSLDGLRLFFAYDSSTIPSQERLLGQVDLEWTRYRFMLGGEYGPTLWNHIKPLAGVAVGYALQDLTVRAQDVRSDFTHDLAVEGFLGLDYVTTIAQWETGQKLNLYAGGRLGWQMQTEARFDELDSDADDEWSRVNNDLGVLDTDGMFWNLGVGLSFAF
ncbi:MAG: hypothetical protein R3E66_12845 [bacterium]